MESPPVWSMTYRLCCVQCDKWAASMAQTHQRTRQKLISKSTGKKVLREPIPISLTSSRRKKRKWKEISYIISFRARSYQLIRMKQCMKGIRRGHKQWRRRQRQLKNANAKCCYNNDNLLFRCCLEAHIACSEWIFGSYNFIAFLGEETIGGISQPRFRRIWNLIAQIEHKLARINTSEMAYQKFGTETVLIMKAEN